MNYSDILGNYISDTISNEDQQDIFDDLLKGTSIRLDETPLTLPWKLVPLTDDDNNIWQIGQSSHNTLEIATKIGPHSNEGLNQKLTNVETIVSANTLKDARKLYLEKYKSGYVPFGGELPVSLSGPMLSKCYCPPGEDKLNSRQTRISKFPVSVMPKIDGIRALAKLQGNQVILRSRLNNLFPHMIHIKREISEFLRYLPPYCELDGDLFNQKFSFGLITSIIKTTKELHSRHGEIQYWIFDILDPQNLFWEDRYGMLVNAYIKYLEDGNSSKHFTVIQAYNANNHDEIHNYHDRFVKEGYEGVMIRRYGSVDGDMSRYKTGRNNNLVKYKLCQDSEVTLVKFNDGKYLVRDEKGQEFLIDSLPDQKAEVGNLLTIKYTSEKIIAVAFRDYK